MSLQKQYTRLGTNDPMYNFTNFIVVGILLGLLLAAPVILNNSFSAATTLILSIISFFISFIVSSFYYLDHIEFYSNRIEVSDFVKYGRKKRTILLTDVLILKYNYIGGRGSGGTGILKVYYKKNNHKGILRCAIDRELAFRLFDSSKVYDIATELKPDWLFANYSQNKDEHL